MRDVTPDIESQISLLRLTEREREAGDEHGSLIRRGRGGLLRGYVYTMARLATSFPLVPHGQKNKLVSASRSTGPTVAPETEGPRRVLMQ